MNLPQLYGTINQSEFFIYSACDSQYFDEFGRSFINSVLTNTSAGIHVHIFNPTCDQLDFCLKSSRISVSYEHVSAVEFAEAGLRWHSTPTNREEKTRKDRILTAMEKGGDRNIIERMQKTYYACARFIRLNELVKPADKFLAVDIDAVVRSSIPGLSDAHDCYMYKITGNKARILAGALYSQGTVNSVKFINEYATVLLGYINRDYLYWSLDQDVLDNIVPKYNVGDLPYSLIDWDMKPASVIWTAKGERKSLNIFKEEQDKYKD